MKVLAIAVVSLLLMSSLVASSAQQARAQKKATVATRPKAPPLKPATVSGRVFALTKGGDLKPARLAKIYMFYSRPLGEPADRIVETPASSTFAADVFEKEVRDGLEEARAGQADKPYLKETTICNNLLTRGYEGAIVNTLHWGGEQSRTQFIFADADEEGRFQITIPPPDIKDASFEVGVPRRDVFVPGVYLLVAYGAAGYNNAVWKSEVEVEPGATLEVKMSEPEMACLKMDSE